MDLQNFLQDERKKKILIISGIVLFVVLGSIFIFSRNNPAPVDTTGDGQTQLLDDLAGIAPRDGVAQDQNRLVAPLVKVSADVPVVAPGQPSVISWNATNATSCVDGSGNAIRTSGSLSITPTENYTMDVVCTNPKGTTIESITVAVTTTPIITLSASPESVLAGEQSFISWNTVNTTRCTDSAGKTLRLSGGMPVVISKPYTFEINCSGPNGTDKKSITVGISTVKTTESELKYVWVFKSKATATSASKTSTFQTSAGCQSAYENSTAYSKTACTKVPVGTAGSTTVNDSNSGGTVGGEEILVCITLNQTLELNSTDANANGEVTVLQKFLNRKGFLSAAPSGNFGSLTEDAVKQFQISEGIPATGKVDAETKVKIKSVSCADAEAAAKKLADEINAGKKENETTTVGEGTLGPKIKLTMSPDTIGFGQTAVLTWEIADAVSCIVKPLGGSAIAVVAGKTRVLEEGKAFAIPDDTGFSGSYSLKLNGADLSVKFEFKCSGAGITATNQKTLYWDTASASFTEAATIDDLEASPTAIAEAAIGAESEVSWTAYNATSCKVSGDAYTRILTDSGEWKSLKGLASAAPTTGVVRIKPGFEGSQVPYHSEQVTTTCPPYSGDGGDYCIPTTSTVTSGDGARKGNETAVVTVSCTGPIKPDPKPKSVAITITPTPPPSGGGGGW
ncbi:MAG: peptidoglycan-binding protein [Candidatus Pacebacteria bacterium]|jgi:hypothetical protein|nr:peptidoglycan-binding protein [Candidatus Paceibacterota bacterium]